MRLYQVILYKHINCTDTAIEVLKKFYVKEKKLYKMRIRWWNIGMCHEPWCMAIDQKVEIPLDIWHRDWQMYNMNRGGTIQ